MMIDEYIDSLIEKRVREIITETLEPITVLKDFREVEILTLDEVCKVLRLDVRMIREACLRNELPHQRVGRTILFPKRTLAAYLCGEWQKPVKEKKRVKYTDMDAKIRAFVN